MTHETDNNALLFVVNFSLCQSSLISFGRHTTSLLSELNAFSKTVFDILLRSYNFIIYLRQHLLGSSCYRNDICKRKSTSAKCMVSNFIDSISFLASTSNDCHRALHKLHETAGKYLIIWFECCISLKFGCLIWIVIRN